MRFTLDSNILVRAVTRPRGPALRRTRCSAAAPILALPIWLSGTMPTRDVAGGKLLTTTSSKVFLDTAFASSFVVMRERGLSDALTLDRHFQQAGFRPLLLESERMGL